MSTFAKQRWSTWLALIVLVVAVAVGAYAWHRHEDAIERAVHAQLGTFGLEADWVSCAEDHTAPADRVTLTYYRCDLHGEERTRRNGLVPVGSQVCMPFVGARVAREDEVRHVRFADGFCENSD